MIKFEDVLKGKFPDRYSLFKSGKLGKKVTVKQFADPSGALPVYPDSVPEELAESLVRAILFHVDYIDYLLSNYPGDLVINDWYRTYDRAESLKKSNPNAASMLSPHVFGIATDLKDRSVKGPQDKLFDFITSTPYGKSLRIGYVKYNKQFIHIDCAFNLPLKDLYTYKLYITDEDTYKKLVANWKTGVRW